MLRITVHDEQTAVTFKLDGGLVGSWVQELDTCWRGTLAADSGKGVRFDLREVTFIDATGKDFLVARHAEGAELVASGCMTRAIVAEILESAVSDGVISNRDIDATKNSFHIQRGL